MSAQQSNDALSVAEETLKRALIRIKIYQTDGRVVVDQAHDIARLVVSCFFHILYSSTYLCKVSSTSAAWQECVGRSTVASVCRCRGSGDNECRPGPTMGARV